MTAQLQHQNLNHLWINMCAHAQWRKDEQIH